MEKECNSTNCDKCFECGKYYSSHSAHYEKGYKNQVINISCCYGNAGTYDAETRERVSIL